MTLHFAPNGVEIEDQSQQMQRPKAASQPARGIYRDKIKRILDVTAAFIIIPITTIPYMESRRRCFARRASILGATVFVLISVPLALWYIDTNYLPLELIVQKGLSRLGLG